MTTTRAEELEQAKGRTVAEDDVVQLFLFPVDQQAQETSAACSSALAPEKQGQHRCSSLGRTSPRHIAHSHTKWLMKALVIATEALGRISEIKKQMAVDGEPTNRQGRRSEHV